jgi:hypothetical protein
VCLLLSRTGQCSLKVRLVQAGWWVRYESFGGQVTECGKGNRTMQQCCATAAKTRNLRSPNPTASKVCVTQVSWSRQVRGASMTLLQIRAMVAASGYYTRDMSIR